MNITSRLTRAEDMTWPELQRINDCDRYIYVNALLPRRRGEPFPGMSDCTLGGVTSKCELSLFVPHPRGNFTLKDLTETSPHAANNVVLEIIEPPFEGCQIRFKVRGEKRNVMAGGNFVESCDSRFSELYRYPCSVHDRHEG
jgi:hypothetical protein